MTYRQSWTELTARQMTNARMAASAHLRRVIDRLNWLRAEQLLSAAARLRGVADRLNLWHVSMAENSPRYLPQGQGSLLMTL